MENKDITFKINKLRTFYNSNKTLDYAYRLSMLKRLKSTIIKYESDIYSALKLDLNKSVYESHMTELSVVISELDLAIKNLHKWMKPKRKKMSLSQMPGSVRVHSEPYGVVLIISPWNYPFQLAVLPLIGAIAAGNCACVKPSAYSANTSKVINRIVSEAFDEHYICVVEGGREENTELLNEKFDYIFFTGNPTVGRIVMSAAARNLTPVTLELGGKSPCIVDKDIDIEKTAKRILFGKLMNLGQTCVAPDYLMVHEGIKNELIDELKNAYHNMISDETYLKSALPHIINLKHYNRLKSYLSEGDIIFGGKTYDDSMHISLTLLDNMKLDGPLMTEEIFGPILPILTWKKTDDVISFVNSRPKPLALYLFTNNKQIQDAITKQVSYGGGCINDTILHIASHHQPFGGVGNSGMGSYHGYETFKTFSHQKNILKKWWILDLAVRYHPYKNTNNKLPKILSK